MMNAPFRLLIVLALAGAGMSALGACQTDGPAQRRAAELDQNDREGAARELFHRSGLEQLLSTVQNAPRVVVAAQYKRQLNPQQIACIDAQFQKSAAGALADLNADVVAQLAHGIDGALFSALRFWRTDVADRWALMLSELSSKAGELRFAAALSRWRGEPPDPALLRRAKDLAGRSGDGALFTRLSFDAAALYAAALRDEPTALPDEAAGSRPQFLSEANRRVQQRYLYVLERVAEEDGIAALRFWRSPAGQWFKRARNDAVLSALVAASRRTRTNYATRTDAPCTRFSDR